MPANAVALLRGINVGRAKRIAMADLRQVFVSLGYLNVRTLLNSGNVVFTFPGGPEADSASRIEQAIEKTLGVSSRVTVLPAAELAAIVAENPLLDRMDDPARFLVGILKGTEERRRLEPLLAKDWTPDALAAGGRHAYLWCATGILDSPLVQAFNRALKDGVTTRNWTTFTKLQELAQGGG